MPTSLLRLEDDRFVTGTGRFTGDLSPSGEVPGPVLRAQFVRSTEAHARLVAIDTQSAVDATGVWAVFTAGDLEVRDFPSSSFPVQLENMDRPVLARELVRYAGEVVAVVLASKKEDAVDAAGLVWIDYEPLPVVSSVDAALTDDVVLHEDAGTNVVERWSFATPGPPPPIEHEISIEVVNGRVVPNPMEPLAILAVPDGGGLTVHVGHQRPHEFRDLLCAQLGLSPDRVRVVVPDVGGAFGMKGMAFPEYAAVAASALELGLPVEWVQTRREHFLTGTHGRGQRHRVTLGGRTDGRILRARVEILADVGAYPHNGARVPNMSRYVATGLYDFAHVEIESTTVVTNLAPTGSYRGAGRPEAAYAIERAVDAYCRSLRLDPFDIRRRNVIRGLPHRSHTGALYDSGDYVQALDRAEHLADVATFRAEQAERRRLGRSPVGLGVASFVERAGGSVDAGEYARAKMRSDGILEVHTGSVSAGQGHETVWPQIAAASLGISPDRVVLVAGDTGRVARGTGTAASRSTMIGGSAVFRTAGVVGEKARRHGAGILEADPADVVVTDAGVAVMGSPGSLVAWDDLVAHAEDAGDPLVAEEWYVPGAQTFPYGVVVAEVEVDAEIGTVDLRRLVAVDDFGNVVNPMIVEGQVHGSLTQGMAQALLEEVVYSPEAQLLTASFMDYPLPVATDTVELITDRLVHPAPSNALGAKGAGESGCIGAPPAIVNAVLDALTPWGVDNLQMPVTPSQVWEAIRSATTSDP